MRTAGWISLIVGTIGFLGAATNGSNVFGPVFWIALGIFLLYRASNRNSDKENISTSIRQKTINNNRTTSKTVIKTKPTAEHNMEKLEDIQAQLTIQHREAAMCLIAFFAGYNNDLMDDAPSLLLQQAAIFFRLPYSPMAMSKMMSKYTDADTLVDIVLTIEPIKAKEFLLLTFHDLIKASGNSEAYDLLFNIANDMGYERTSLVKLIKQYQ